MVGDRRMEVRDRRVVPPPQRECRRGNLRARDLLRRQGLIVRRGSGSGGGRAGEGGRGGEMISGNEKCFSVQTESGY